jgi:hypothetical protein
MLVKGRVDVRGLSRALFPRTSDGVGPLAIVGHHFPGNESDVDDADEQTGLPEH